jgi:aspartyl/asparaginyl beta-hydroxylase (cupin superfamily)
MRSVSSSLVVALFATLPSLLLLLENQVFGFFLQPKTSRSWKAIGRRPFFCHRHNTRLSEAKGFGTNTSAGGDKQRRKKSTNRLVDILEDRRPQTKGKPPSINKPYVKSEQDQLIESLAARSAQTHIGQAVSQTQNKLGKENDSFWELMPALINSRFPTVTDDAFQRVAGMVRHALSQNPNMLLDDDIIQDPWRPHDEIHAYMPGLGPTQPFWDPSQLSICQKLSDNYEIIRSEYEALLSQDKQDRFQSVTSMNYDSGWKTLVLFYNGHRIAGFPYHLCPTTTKLMETLPLAGRIAGFNRQAPSSGIPLHSDGNNMWLTLQMGIQVPEGEKAWIRVGPETKRWKNGECILYDTTYEHETMNEHKDQERIVLHIDFFNTLRMTTVEIEVMRYIYSLREEYMKAEGVSKVGKQLL